MTNRTSITDADIAKEHRLRRIAGSPVDAITNPALRICLANCAELRKKQHPSDQPSPDGKRLAAGDIE
jgi:hypothetical protein